MGAHTFRDRFFTRPVSRAATSPSAFVALGLGAAVGIVATAGTAGLAAPVVAGILGGAVGYGGRVALAIPRGPAGAERIDPFGVNEPWRHAVQDALEAQQRFGEAIRATAPGPLRTHLDSIAERVGDAVHECWRVAQQGQVVADARKRIDDREIQWERTRQQTQVQMAGGAPTDTQARTLASLDAQLATAARMDQAIASTRDELDLINARLDESVTQAVELSVSTTSDVGSLGTDVEGIVDALQALRQAMSDLDRPSGGAAPVPAQPGPPPAIAEPPAAPRSQPRP